MVAQIRDDINCNLASLPLPYLGLPLTDSKPDKACFLPLIAKVDRRLASWKGRFISRAGRITLASAVLSSMPLHFMSVFMLPAWVITEIDKIRRNFIWGTKAGGTKNLSLLAWDRVCLPKCCGGLGLQNLKLQNKALLLRWLWKLQTHSDCLWTSIAKAAYEPPNSTPPLLWNPKGSFFWKDLFSIRLLLQLSTYSIPGDGNSTSFWFDNWGAGHHSFFHDARNTVRPPRMNRLIATADNSFFRHLPRPWTLRLHAHVQAFNQLSRLHTPDQLAWKWTNNGHFSVNSAYKAFSTAGKTDTSSKLLWKVKVPPTIKLFSILLFHDKILTQDVLLRRHILVQPGCCLCNGTMIETAAHLFVDCSFAQAIWTNLACASHLPRPCGDLRSFLTTAASWTTNCNTQAVATRFFTALWGIWLERNNRVFRGERRTVRVLLAWIVEQSAFVSASLAGF